MTSTTSYKNKGFTLIELLVVIAIIGILSAVILASLSTARSKGSDAGIKANLHTVATQSAVFLSNNSNTFGTFNVGGVPGTCPVAGAVDPSIFGDATVENAIASAVNDSGGGASLCMSTPTSFAAAVQRPVDIAATTTGTTGSYWCVDNSGKGCSVDAITGPSCGTCLSTN